MSYSLICVEHTNVEHFQAEVLQACLLHIAVLLFSIHNPRWHNIQGASLVSQMAKNLPAMQKTQAWPLGQEDPLEKGMATYSSILTWRNP